MSAPQKSSLHPSELQHSKKIQNYIFRFSDLLGQGNFSKVYKAHHQITNEIVAIKIIELNSLKSKKLEELLFSEIEVLKKLNHPNILRCYEVFSSNRNCYIITELCNGGDLETKLKEKQSFTEVAAEPIIKDIFDGLLYLAQKNVIHRDLKVANVFLHNGRAKIADFGFAKFTINKFKDVNIGSPIYMSPEGFISNLYGPKTDIWAFGILIYELFHGQTPFSFCKSESELRYNLPIPISPAKIRGSMSAQLKEIMLRCLQVDEGKRITAFELASYPYFSKGEPLTPLRLAYDKDSSHRNSTEKIPPASYNNSRTLSTNKTPQRDEPYKLKTEAENNSQFYRPMNSVNLAQNSSLTAPRHYQTNHITVSDFSRPSKLTSTSLNRSHNFGNNLDGPESMRVTRQGKSQEKRLVHGLQETKPKTSMFSANINFKQSVNLLHYCRLMYKFIQCSRGTSYCPYEQLSSMGGWLMSILAEMNERIENAGVTYDGENAKLREKKLREVVQEYTRKYKTELSDYLFTSYKVEFVIGSVRSHLVMLASHIGDQLDKDHSNKTLVFLGLSLLRMVEFSGIFYDCYLRKDYSQLSRYKEIETFLNQEREAFNYDIYLGERSKVNLNYSQNRTD